MLFLQSYRMKLGGRPVLLGVMIGMMFSGTIAILTLLGGVLLVMVGEQAQEFQLIHWLPTTDLPSVATIVRPWMGVWFSIFPTVETLAAQSIAAVLVLGSYFVARAEAPRRAV